MNYLNLLPLASSLICGALALFVLFRRQWRIAAIAFALGMAFMAMMELANYLAISASSAENIMLWKRVSLTAEIAVIGTWLVFAIIFAKEDLNRVTKKWWWVAPLAYILPSGLLVFLFHHGQMALTDDHNIIIVGAAARYFHISLLLTVILSLVGLENTFRSSAGHERSQIKYLLFAIGAILSLFIYVLTNRLLYSFIDKTNIYLMSSVILVACIMIIYSIVKFNVIDDEVYVSRRVIYTSISLIAIGLYSITVAIFVHIIRMIDITRNLKLDIFIIFVAILIMVIVFYHESLRRKTKAIINRNFRKSKYVYRDEWMVFSSELSKKINTDEVCKVLLKNLSERLLIKHLSIWLIDDDNRTFSLVSSHGINEIDIKINIIDRTIQYIYYKNKPVSVPDIKTNKELLPITREVSILLDKTKAQLIVPLILGKRWVGLLTLGKIQTGQTFDLIEDYDLLRSVAAHAASAINNAILFEKHMEAKELESFSRLSSFMMHDLKNATSMLDMVVQNAKKHFLNPDFQEDAIETISDAVEKMKKMMHNLSTFHTVPDMRGLSDRGVLDNPASDSLERRWSSESRFNDLDLNKVIHAAVNDLSMNGLASVDIEKSLGAVPRVFGDVEEIYKVVYNLLLNAYEAVDGDGLIKIITKESDDYVVCRVCDNGPGMSPEFIQRSLFRPFKSTKENGLGIGLYQCKAIVEVHDGWIEVESVRGEGTTFSVYLPSADHGCEGDRA